MRKGDEDMAFSYDISTDRGKVRFLIQDNDSTNYAFQDGEIDFLISAEAVSFPIIDP